MRVFEGVFVPLITFFDEEGNVDIQSQQRHVANLLNAGVHGLVPMASMGEFNAMERHERRDVAVAVIEEASGRAKVVVGTGAPSTRQAVMLSKDAEAAGADGVMVVTPFYGKPGPDALRRHYEAIREAVEIPIVAYTLPSFTGVDLPANQVLELAEAETIQALKDSSGDLARALEVIDAMPENFSYLTGSDPLFSAVVIHGGQGGIIGSSNVFPDAGVGLFNLLRRERLKEAIELQMKLARFAQASRVGTYPAAAKYLVGRVWDLHSTCRPPAVELTEEEKETVSQIIMPLLS